MALDLWQQVQQVFDAALQEFLEQECGSNQELRREVESLLAAHDESGSFMAKPAVAGMAEVLHRATSRFHPGDTLGAYKVLDLVGRGGMGEVYRARETRLKRDVAIKVLPRAFAADRERLRRFEQEARSAAALNHPNIISVHDMGTADGSPYIVSELLEGQNLREVLRQGAVPARKALDYSMQAAGGLAAAHDVGIIHRDLKPENLFITKDGHLKILDFGLAKLMRPEGGGSDSSTAEAVPGTEAGRVFGTVGYMSPEQVRGQSADHRSDIFSFGTILYELFSGKRAFSGDSPTDTMSAILHQDPPELTRATPPVHPMVDHTIRHCLEKNPLERFQSAHDLRFQLQVAAEGLSPQPETAAIQVDAKPATASLTIAVSGERLRRTVGVMAALATLVLALSAAAAWWVLRSRPENRAGSAVRDDAARRVLAVLPFDNISNDRSQDYFSAGVTEEINGQLSKLASLQVLSRTAVARYKDPKSNLRQIATELGVGSVVLGSVRQEGSRVRIHVEVVDPRNDRTVWSDQYDRELKDIFAVQSDVALRIADALQAKLTSNEQERIEKRSTENMAAYQIYLRSQELKSSDRQKNLEALRMLQQAIQLDPKFAVAQARMAYRTIFQSYFDDPQYIDSGMEMARKALALDASLADAHFALAFGYYQKGQATNARLSLLKAIELTPSHDGAMMNLSAQETDLGRYNEALNWARRAFRLAPSGIAYYHVGYPLLYLGDDATTEKWLTEGEQHFPNGMRIQILLAMLDLLRGRERDALERARKAAVVESGSEEISMLLADLALITGAADAETRVERFFRSAPDLSAGMWILPESFRVRYAYLLARRGETSRATQLMEQAASLARQTLDNGNELPRVRLELAAIYAVRQQKKPALDWLQEAYDAGWRDPRTLERDPMFQDLREEPRFKELLGRLKRDVAAMRERSSDLRELLTTAAPKSSNSSPKPSQ